MTKVNLTDYIFWDEVQRRWDITSRAYSEQCDPQVRAIIEAVLRSWFGIPLPFKVEQQLPLMVRR